jgi:hypothetical protein
MPVSGAIGRDLNQGWYHKAVALVAQEPVLYARTIFDNIVMGMGSLKKRTLCQGDAFMAGALHTVVDVEALAEATEVPPSMAEVVEACKLANAHQFIVAMPNGYHTEVGRRGGDAHPCACSIRTNDPEPQCANRGAQRDQVVLRVKRGAPRSEAEHKEVDTRKRARAPPGF